MAKRSNRGSIDPITEAQHNARWFMGYRRYIPWSQKNRLEWYQFQRSLPVYPRWQSILFITLFAIVGLALIVMGRGSLESIVAGGLALMPAIVQISSMLRGAKKDGK